MITVDVFLLHGHKPSGNVSRMVDLYLEDCPGVVVGKTWVKSGPQLKTVLHKQKVHNLPAMNIPGGIRAGKKVREVLTDQEEMERWCRETVQKIDAANRRKGRR